MKTHSEQSLISSVEAASQPGAAASAQGQALDSARAQFRAAWQAKQERAERIRTLARNVGSAATWSLRIALLLVLMSGGVLGWKLLNGVKFPEALRTAPYLSLVWGFLGCSVIHGCTSVLEDCLQRSADRLEAAEVRYS